MKSKKIFMLSAVLALSLCACTGNHGGSNGGKSSKPKQTPVADPTMEVAFTPLNEDEGENVLVPDYVKDYVDQMHEQEDKITFPNRVDRLFCNMTWEEAAAEADKGDGTKYSEAKSGGVDVCQILNRNMKYECKPIELKWDKGEKTFSENARLVAWSEVDKSDKREFKLEADGNSAKMANLFRNTEYCYQIIDGDQASQMGKFVTADYTRMITMGNISNVRDMGGYMTSYGKRVNQGLIYRGGEMAAKDFTDGSNRHSKNWTDAAQEVQKDVLNIGLELDLRTKSGSGSMTESNLDWEGEWEQPNTNTNLANQASLGNVNKKAQYVRCAINSYDSFITDQNRKNEAENANRDLVPEIFEYFANADKQHVYFHCWGGADRTGVSGFLLLGILGVSYTDAIIDFELTTLTNNKRCHMHNSSSAHMPKFLKLFTSGYEFERDGQKYEYKFDGEKTLNVNATNLLLAMGVKQETIEKIRTIMLPGYKTGDQEVERENKPYTDSAEVVWLSDLLAHDECCDHE